MARSWLQISSLLFVLVVLSPSLGGKITDQLAVKPAPVVSKSEGDNITLRCEATFGVFKGPPSWTFKGQSFGNNEADSKYVKVWTQKKSVNELHIQNAQLGDGGLYVCSAEKRDGDIISLTTIRIILRALSKPTVLINSNITRNKSQNIEISCNVTGNPQPEVSWFRNGGKIDTTATAKDETECEQLQSGFYEFPRETVAEDEKWRLRLLICSANQFDHTGSYSCRATNTKGNSTGVTYLNILEKPTVNVTKSQLEVDNTVELICSATGNPPPLVSWQKEENEGLFLPLEGEDGQWALKSSVINLQVSEDTYGTYRCVAKNSQGSSEEIQELLPASNKVATVVSIAFGILVTIGLFAGSLKCFFLLKKRKSSADNIQILSSEFVYHAFIIYSQEDSKWVTGKLLPCLEEKHNFKCCVHYRDFIPGKPFEESMAESVYTSHKVIAVMSRNFFKSNYCRYELNIAKYRLLNKGDDSLIIIRIDNEDCRKLPKELRKRNFIDFSNPLERPLWEQKLLRFLNVQWEINQDCAVELSCEIENTDDSSALLPRRGGRLNSEINAVDQNRRPVTEYDSLSEEHETVL